MTFHLHHFPHKMWLRSTNIKRDKQLNKTHTDKKFRNKHNHYLKKKNSQKIMLEEITEKTTKNRKN